MVGMQMRIDGLDQSEIEFAQQLAVAIDLFQHRVEDQRLAPGAAGQQIAVGSRNAVEQLPKDHVWRACKLIQDITMQKDRGIMPVLPSSLTRDSRIVVDAFQRDADTAGIRHFTRTEVPGKDIPHRYSPL